MKPLRVLVDDFLAKKRMSATAFGVAVLRDPNLVFDLRAGRDVRLSTDSKIRNWIRNYRRNPPGGGPAHAALAVGRGGSAPRASVPRLQA